MRRVGRGAALPAAVLAAALALVPFRLPREVRPTSARAVGFAVLAFAPATTTFVSGDVSRVAAFANSTPCPRRAPPVAEGSAYRISLVRGLPVGRTRHDPQVEATFPPGRAFSSGVAMRCLRRRSNL